MLSHGHRSPTRKEKAMEANDMKAMREACTNIAEYANAAKCHTTDAHILGYLDQIESWAKAAISAPPRNRDAGTADEQYQRFKKYCKKKTGGCGRADRYDNPCAYCFSQWAQMTYTEGGAK